MGRLPIALALGAAAMMVAGGARAADGAAPDAQTASVADVRELVREGTACFLREDYACAHDALAQAFAAAPEADTALKLALSELQTHRPVDAVAHFQAYLSHAEQPAEKLEAVRSKWLPRAQAQTANVSVAAPAGAAIAVDGVLQGRGPAVSIVVAAGDHTVSATQGDLVERQQVSARGGELVELHFQRVADAPERASDGAAASHVASSSPAKWIAFGGLAGAALLAAGAGVGFGEFDRGSRVGRALSVAGYVGAGVLGASAVAALVFWPSGTSVRVGFAPRVGPDGTSASLVGVW